jgi:muramoyltetrapeptide carboxypeptidase
MGWAETEQSDASAQASRVNPCRIAVVAPSSPLSPEVPARVQALAERRLGSGAPELVFHPQCFESAGHFAGEDPARAAAFVEVANDPGFDVVWFARGGYGSGRLIEAVLASLGPVARGKTYMGYSDAGALLGALYGAGFGGVAHGPMPQDILREGGEAAALRALAWLARRDPAALEPAARGGGRFAAFNIATLDSLVGTPFQPDLSGHVLMLEEVSEYLYRIDRFLFHITSNPQMRKVAGIRLGRCSAIPDNDPDFGIDAEAVVRFWCARSGVVFLGCADIGHDADNKVVPFGAGPF